jgi:ADP-ribose pyrophosphatase
LLKVDLIEVAMEDGRGARREIVHHPGAVAVLATLPDVRFMLVRQYRKAVEQPLLEVVAGCLEPGEDPSACATREVQEETGHRVVSLHSLGRIFPTPGYSDEVLHLFHASVTADRANTAPDEDERIDVVYLTAAELEALMAQDRLLDGKTLILWLRAKALAHSHATS